MEFKPNQDGLLVVSRHGKKAKVDRKKIKPGSDKDKTLVKLSKKGFDELVRLGEAVLGDNVYSDVVSKYSDFIRTEESTLAFLKSARDAQRAPPQYYEKRRNLGFGVDGINWNHPVLPKFGIGAVLDNYVKTLYSQFYLQGQNKKLPCMAEFSHGLITAMVDTVQNLQKGYQQGKKSLGTVFTHSPIIDAATMFLTDVLSVTNGSVQFNEWAFDQEGAFAEGDLFFGEMFGLGTDNPTIQFTMRANKDYFEKGSNKNPTRVGYKLSDLVRKQKEIYDHTQIGA